MEYASKGVGNAGLTTGIIGTALGALNGAGGLGIFGSPRHESDEYITRFDAGLMRDIEDRDRKIALLEADKYTDKKIADLADKMNTRFNIVEGQIAQQGIWNATQTGLIGSLQGQVAQLQALTKLVVPSSNVMTPSTGA